MHTHDIQGRPWSSCEACPHATPGACPSRRHRAYCELAKTRPELVASEPAEERPARDVPPPLRVPSAFSPMRKRVADGARIKAVALMAACVSGGAEDATETMVRATARDIDWTGAVVDNPSLSSPEMLARMRAVVPEVALGKDRGQALAWDADVVVGWGVRFRDYLGGDGPRPSTVYVSHAPPESVWGNDLLADAGSMDAVVGVSPETLRLVDSSRVRTVLIPNVPNIARLAPTVGREEFRAALGVADSQILIGMVGRLSQEKRPGMLAEVLARLPERFAGVLVGSGHEFEYAAVSAWRAKVSHRVRLLPERPDVGTVYHAIDALFGASAYESYWLAAVEAMACGCPVVSTDVGVVRANPGLQLARTAGQGADDLAAAMREDFDDPAGQLERVARAKAWALAQADPAAFRASWVGLLDRLARPRPGPAKATFDPALAEDVRRAKACPHRGCRAGCQKTRCEKYQKDVYLSDCRECISEGRDR